MPKITCKHCGKSFEPAAQTLLCRHCQQDVAADVLATLRPLQTGPKMSKSMVDTDSAQTLKSPGLPIDATMERQIGESSRTLDSAGQSPLLGHFSSTLQPTDSVLESVDLSSAIPPRGITTDDKPGEAKDYRLGKKLGSGSFGVVYRAEQIALQRNVALKMLKPRGKIEDGQSDDTHSRIKSQRVKDRNEFLREAQFTGKLEHPNIVPVHDIGLVATEAGTGNRPFYVMKEIRGESWQETIKQNTRSENLDVLQRVAEAIGYAHSKKILHCDLKPENVMLGEFGEVLVVDWGQAIDTSRPETFRPGGSPAYISPEMAKYWCDIFLDQRKTSLAVKDIGPQSDVYLLGAMLFEIVSAKPPHFGLKGETAHDVMRRAIENQISNHHEWMEDELMVIARHALRIDTSVSYQTVTEFLDALKQYETRHVSIDLRDRAMELLDEAKANDNYDAYGRAQFGFEEAIEKWEGNELAKTGLSDARLSCAELALKDQNFDLGIGMLDEPETAQEVAVRKKLVAEKSKRDRRKKLIGFLSIGLVLAGIASIGLIGVAANQMAKASDAVADAEVANESAETAKLAEEVAKKEAEKLAKDNLRIASENEAKEAKLKADFEQKEIDALEEFDIAKKAILADQKKLLAVQEAIVAEQVEIAERKTGEAKDATTAAEKAQEAANKATRLAAAAESRNRLLKYKDGIGKIENAVREGDFATATNELNSASNKEAKGTVEWSRLKMLTHPESAKFQEQDLPVDSAAASLDGKRLVVVSEDQVVVRDSATYAVVDEFEIPGASVAALSADGSTLAAGVPGEVGKIVVVQNGKRIELNKAPSKNITDLQFSSDGNLLLCVGEVDRVRKAIGIEKELMIYQSDGGSWMAGQAKPIPVLLTFQDGPDDQKGRQFGFTNGEFSRDGKRILLSTNARTETKTSQGKGRSIHVLELSPDRRYERIAGSDSTSIDVAIFADDDGTAVVGCQTEEGVSELFSWNVKSSAERFVSTDAPEETDSSLVKIENVSARIRSMKRVSLAGNAGVEDYVLTAGDDKKISLWNLDQGLLRSPEYFGGHSTAIDLCTLIPSEKGIEQSQLISVVYGSNPEVLKTDLSEYNADEETLTIGNGQSKTLSPVSLFISQDRKLAVLGQDNAHVTLKSLAAKDGIAVTDESTEWDVSAWKRHSLSRDLLFAQSDNDEFMRFDRQTGALTGVLTRLAQENKGSEIERFQVSNDGQIALVETDSDQREFQIWDLTNQVLVKRIDYSTLIDSKFPQIKLSADGKYVVAGKIGFVVWSTEADRGVAGEPIFNRMGNNRSLTFPKNPINNVVFYQNDAGECEFAVSWPEAKGRKTNDLDVKKPTGRIHIYTKRGQAIELVGRFRVEITGGAFDPELRATVPNTFDARMIDGSRYILVRSSESVDLLKLNPGEADPAFADREWDASEKIVSFDNAKYVRFSDRSNDVLILNKANTKVAAVQRWSFESKVTDELNLGGELAKNFPEFPRGNIATIQEGLDGTITIQRLATSRANRSRKVYNTLSLNEDFSVAALRVMANPQVEYAAMAKDIVLTLDSGTIRKWKLVRNSDLDNRSSQLVKPDGVLEGFYQTCQVSPDGSQLLVTERGSGSIMLIDPNTGNLISNIDSPSDIAAKPTAVTWSESDSSKIAIGFANGAIRIFNLAEGKIELDALQPVAEFGPIKSLSFAAGKEGVESSQSLFAVLEGGDAAGLDEGLQSMSIEELKVRAADDEIDLNDDATKADIIKAIQGASDSSEYAVVYQRRAPIEKNDKGDEIKGQEIWTPVVIGYPDRDSHIVTGHISADGTRVVTGSDTGHLTIWRTDLLEAIKGGEEKPDFAEIKEQVKQRELLEVNNYSSSVRFARFFENAGNDNLVDIISADKGGVNEFVNELEIWKTAR